MVGKGLLNEQHTDHEVWDAPVEVDVVVVPALAQQNKVLGGLRHQIAVQLK